MNLFAKIGFVTALGFGVGMGGMAYLGGYFERAPSNRAEAMVWLFEKYCAPLHRGERPPFNHNMAILLKYQGKTAACLTPRI
jgi:hypothetical protein